MYVQAAVLGIHRLWHVAAHAPLTSQAQVYATIKASTVLPRLPILTSSFCPARCHAVGLLITSHAIFCTGVVSSKVARVTCRYGAGTVAHGS